MGIAYCSAYRESTGYNSMRNADFTPVFNDFESIGVIVICLLCKVMLKRLIRQNFINLL